MQNQNLTDQDTLTVGITSYNEGAAITATLNSLWSALSTLGRQNAFFILSDSSDSDATLQAVKAWADRASPRMAIYHSDKRRSLKEALNEILERATSDLLICVNADVVVPADSLKKLLQHLQGEMRCDIAIGTSLPAWRGRGLAGRASTWQLNVVYRLACRRPSNALRADGVFWGSRKAFYSSFRYKIAEGSIADDVQLTEALSGSSWKVRNAFDAVVLKVPASSLRDFAVTALRSFAANTNHVDTPGRAAAAFAEALSDPVGALCYLIARTYTAARRRALRPLAATEYWEIAATTKR
ncbi:MAG: glycosyltransferase family 2 protein [Candidatus Dormibacteraeota bacterium]|nr:glycosyltransferase family 2 protein [Candidatus Dormibacteraeota bacterium]